ncbi:unnamed protein product [Rhodiola kirilowii]
MAEPAMEAQADVASLLKKLSVNEIQEVLSQGFCQQCLIQLESRVRDVSERTQRTSSNGGVGKGVSWSSPQSVNSSKQGEVTPQSSPLSMESNQDMVEFTLADGLSSEVIGPAGLSDDQKEQIRLSKVGRKKDFCYRERIEGKLINLVEGLELHTNVFNAAEQKKIVACVASYQKLGQKNQLLARTYSEPKKWMRGKGRATIQFGCCYNYAVDKDGNPPGIIRDQEVDPLPPLLKNMIKRLVRWRILPSTCVPNSCIVNIYDDGDCIPPHIDHHDFVRPFCTVSFVTESNIVFGHNLKILSPGEFSGPVTIPLPVGSVLILNGNGADVAKHCVPSVRGKRISITFRKMDNDKLPHWYRPDPDLQGLKPLMIPVPLKSLSPVPLKLDHQQTPTTDRSKMHINNDNISNLSLNEFPALGSHNSMRHKKGHR